MSCSIGISTRFLPRAALAMLFGLIGHAAMAQSVQGTATYRERIVLPPDAVFEATLEEVSRADAAASIIATTRVAKPGNPPIRFTLAYDPAKIVAANRYVIRARILLNDQLIFTTDTAPAVITRGSPTDVSIMLRRVTGNQAGSSSSPALAGTSWQLVKFQGGDEKILTPDDGATYTIQFASSGALTARIDCNRGRGSWKSGGPNQLQLSPLALTRALCPAGSLHDQIVKQWANIRSYIVKDGHLFLSLMADGGIYEFEPLETK